jgi:hypothetical protein
MPARVRESAGLARRPSARNASNAALNDVRSPVYRFA